MFEVPEAKRVKRSDLFDQQADDPPSNPENESSTKTTGKKRTSVKEDQKPNSEADITAPDYGFTYEYFNSHVPTSTDQIQDDKAQSYEFNLFQPSRETASTKQHQSPIEALTSSELVATSPSNTSQPGHGRAPSPSSHAEQSASGTRSSKARASKTKAATTPARTSDPLPNPKATKHANLTVSKRPNVITISARSPTPDAALNLFPPTIDLEKAGFTTSRPQSYYLSWCVPKDELDRRKREYVAAAVTQSELLGAARRAWPGTALAAREIYIPSSRLVDRTKSRTLLKGKSVGDEGRTRGRTRPSKAQRIKIRKVRETKKLAARTVEEKQAAEREKKNAKNRAQKIKRRAKERERKAQSRAVEVGGGQGESVENERATASP